MWLKKFFGSAFRKLKKIWKKIIKGAFGYFMSEVLEFAKELVKSLETSDLTDEEKRNTAFTAIKNEAMRKGIDFKNNWINIVINIVIAIIREEF